MVLYDIANRAGLIVKSAAALDSEIFSHRNLNTFDVVAVLERIQHRVRKPRVKHVGHRPFSKIMSYPENRRLVKCPKQIRIQLPRRREVCPERFFDNHPGAKGTVRFTELFY